MLWPSDRIRVATFRKREKRFFAHVELQHEDGSVSSEIAHLANTGSLKTVIDHAVTGQRCLILHRPEPERKLKWSLLAIEVPTGGWVGVDTSIPRRLVQEHFDIRHEHAWSKFESIQFEVKITKETRLDGLLRGPGGNRYFEMKNVTYADGGTAQFPDAVTERGQKHLRELTKLVDGGQEAELIFIIQRSDVERFSPAAHIDARYAELFHEAKKRGVIMTPLVAHISVSDTQASVQLRPARF